MPGGRIVSIITNLSAAPARSLAGAKRGIDSVERHLEALASVNPHSRLYGIVRSMVAFAGLITLLANSNADLFVRTGEASMVKCQGIAGISIYCVIPDLALAKGIAIAVLAAVVIGVVPRWTAIPFWWVAFSFQVSAVIIEGGDQILAITAMLLIPVSLLDGRLTQWGKRRRVLNRHASLTAHFFLTLIRLQAAIIYLVSGTAKFGEQSWQDGTAMFYWMRHPTFGAPAWQSPVYDFLLTNSTLVTMATWLVPVLEIAVAMALFAGPGVRKALLIPVVAMHVLIGVSMGLMSFAIVMIALDLLFLLPIESGKSIRQDRKDARMADGSEEAGEDSSSSADRIARVDV
jgi:antimicrobial peptide system SdpB family protein